MSDKGSKWENRVLAEHEVTEKVKWVLQESTSPEGKKMLGIRKFVTTKAGVKPTAQGILFTDKAELVGVLILLQQAAVATKKPSYIVKCRLVDGRKAYVKWQDGKKFTKDREKAKVFKTKADAEALRDRHGNETWLILKVKQ